MRLFQMLIVIGILIFLWLNEFYMVIIPLMISIITLILLITKGHVIYNKTKS